MTMISVNAVSVMDWIHGQHFGGGQDLTLSLVTPWQRNASRSLFTLRIINS